MMDRHFQRSYPTITFLGAARAVTGSCFLVQTGTVSLLVDCGMFQGSASERELNEREFPFRPDQIDAVVLSHAHIDHSGLLPKLVRQGFSGPIFATAPTKDLCSVMLPDAAYIQEQEAERRSKRNRWRRRRTVDPIYTARDAFDCLGRFRPVPYEVWTEAAEGVRFRFWNAGHLLGSASIEMEVLEDGRNTRILFSGDIGPDSKLMQPDPEAPSGFDYIICESTYGATDRSDISHKSRRQLLKLEVEAARARGGAMLIPSFAVERTQEVLVDLVALISTDDVDPFPIIIDSPLASKATAVFGRHAGELEKGGELLAAIESPHVSFTETVEDSKALDSRTGFHAVIAASGMCDAGRIRHRLKNWLWRPEATVLMVGYQAAGTLGRVLVDGAEAVRIHGSEIAVAATIRRLDVYSGHADAPELQTWVMERLPLSRALFLVHGEPPALLAFKERLTPLIGAEAIIIPELDEGFALTPSGATPLESTRASSRVDRKLVGSPDSANDYANLLLDIDHALDSAADERGRAVIVRRLRRALENE